VYGSILNCRGLSDVEERDSRSLPSYTLHKYCRYETSPEQVGILATETRVIRCQRKRDIILGPDMLRLGTFPDFDTWTVLEAADI
jgi:hypothetical protein